MGTRTYLEMRDEVNSSLGSPGALVTDLQRWVNQAYLAIASGVDFEILMDRQAIPTVDGTQTYAVTGDPLATLLIRNTDTGGTLGWLTMFELYRRDDLTKDVPSHWTRVEADYVLFPIPDAIYNLEAIQKTEPTQLAVDGDTTILPPFWDVAVTMMATHLAMLQLNEEDRATAWLNMFITYVQTRLDEDTLRRLVAGAAPSKADVPVGTEIGSVS